MVFKPFTHLARHKLVKSFTHGYAQTVVAASQSSYAASTASFPPFAHLPGARVGKSGTLQAHNVFQSSSGSSGAGTKAGSSASNHQSDGGLAAYYAAWQQQQSQAHDGDGDGEWEQFQFPKRIEWKASAPQEDGNTKGKQPADRVAEPVTPLPLPDVTRNQPATASSTAVIDEERAVEVDAPASADGASSASLGDGRLAEEVADSGVVHARVNVDASGAAAISSTPPDVQPSPAKIEAAKAAPPSDPRSQPFLDRIGSLHLAGRHEEVPAVFEAMLVANVQPTTEAYNALLTAAVRLSATSAQLVHKALSIYTDMLRRDVAPDVSTYSTLIELMAARALEVSETRQSLQERRARFPSRSASGKSMSAVQDAEYDFLAEDDSSAIALRLFAAARRDLDLETLPLTTYEHLAAVCAAYGKATEMIEVYAHMETQRVAPSTAVFTSMITGFARSWDLVSAVECYNEYKSLAMAADGGQGGLLDRDDESVYVALAKAYVTCYKTEGGTRFLGKVRSLYASGPVEEAPARLQALEDGAVSRAFVDELARLGRFHDALRWVESSTLSAVVRDRALAAVCVKAADRDEVEAALDAYAGLAPLSPGHCDAAVALLAFHLRSGDLAAATTYWNTLTELDTRWSATLIEPSTMYFAGLINQEDEVAATHQARQTYARIRANVDGPEAVPSAAVVEAIDEAIEYLGTFMQERGIVPSTQATMNLVRAMIDNGGLITPVVVQLLSGLGPQSIERLGPEDVTLLAQVQGGMIVSRHDDRPDAAHRARFAHLVETILARGTPLDDRTKHLVEQGLLAVAGTDGLRGRPDLLQRWHGYLHQDAMQASTQLSSSPQTLTPSSPSVDLDASHDPYGPSTDHRGSSIIADALDGKAERTAGPRLKEALSTLKNIRRAGRHPRYITYAKLISAAAKENRLDLTREVLAMARTDIPYLGQGQVVHQGWVAILDAMVAASLAVGDRAAAARYHRELANMGAAPSANTFGLYITTLKEATKTFDEATEAVKVFHRARSEGVEPSSFLYNALIGKLGKARRIDDCLFYFAEMRKLGIRPTSVTYGTVVNALCRVSDERFAEELFEEMESMPNYKPRPAPYNTLMQFFLSTRRDRGKVLAYYDRMVAKGIPPASHTFKLLIDTHATLDPVDMASAEAVLGRMRDAGVKPDAVHYASLIHAKGCTLHDMESARRSFDEVLADPRVRLQPCIFQAFLEGMVANHQVHDTQLVLDDMRRRGVPTTPYIANTLIHGWAHGGEIEKAKAIFQTVGLANREPSTYEAMTRAFLAAKDQDGAMQVIREMSTRGYPSAVVDKVYDLIGLRSRRAPNFVSHGD